MALSDRRRIRHEYAIREAKSASGAPGGISYRRTNSPGAAR
jgi:hypothetical protein